MFHHGLWLGKIWLGRQTAMIDAGGTAISQSKKIFNRGFFLVAK
jgi:hypothetical protein